MACTPENNAVNAKRAKNDFEYDHDECGPLMIIIDRFKNGVVTFRTTGSSKSFDLPWNTDHVWTECPTEADPNVLGVTAKAYLRKKYVRDTLDAGAKALYQRKWPESEAGETVYQELELVPVKLVFEGRVEGENEDRKIEVAIQQDAALDLGSVDVELPGQAKKLHVVRVTLKAKGAIEATIALLDFELSDPLQVLHLADGKITVRLSQQGASTFGEVFTP